MGVEYRPSSTMHEAGLKPEEGKFFLYHQLRSASDIIPKSKFDLALLKSQGYIFVLKIFVQFRQSLKTSGIIFIK
jgi:hypothetical protein